MKTDIPDCNKSLEKENIDKMHLNLMILVGNRQTMDVHCLKES